MQLVDLPLGSSWSAWAMSSGISAAYVGSLYLVPARLRALRRHNPAQIRARMISTSLAAAASVALVAAISRPSKSTFAAPLNTWLGLSGGYSWVWSTTVSLLLTASLFLGPLLSMVMLAVHENSSSSSGFASNLAHILYDKSGWETAKTAITRNLIVGPITEEVVFRACILPLLICNGVSRSTAICCSPMLFGLAHVHHVIEGMRAGHSLLQAVLQVVVQLTYTSAFGAYAAFIHLRTGHLPAAIVCHMFCNYMGVPDLDFNTPPSDYTGSLSVLYPHRKIILAVYGVGILIFLSSLSRATDSLAQQSFLWQASSASGG